MFDEFVDNTERYEEFIEELLEANREGRFDDVFNRAYGMGTFSIDELIDIYARVDNDCVTNYRSKNESEEAVELEALRLAILQSLSEANTSAIFKCIASTGSWSEFFAGTEPVFHIYYSRFSDRIGFDCSRLAGITCNMERGKEIMKNENCHPSFREALESRKDF